MKIVFTPQSRDDLREVENYISQVLDNPTAARSITQKVLKSTLLLEKNPHLGIELSKKTLRETPYRCLFSGNYGIFYLENGQEIRVIRILDLRTDYLKSFFES